MNSKLLLFLVLWPLLVVGLSISVVSAAHSDDWSGLLLNLGTELAGAAVT